MKKFGIGVLGVLLILSAAVAMAADNAYEVAGVDDPAIVKAFVLSLQSVVKNNDAAAFAKMISYPMKVHAENGPGLTVKTAKQAQEKYAEIVNAKVKQAILSQNPDDLFANYQGLMIGDGEVWLTPNEHGELKILSINQ